MTAAAYANRPQVSLWVGAGVLRLARCGENWRYWAQGRVRQPSTNASDPGLGFRVLHQQLAVAAVETVRERLRIRNPVLDHAMLLVLCELRADVAVGGSRTQHLDHQVRRTCDVIVADQVLAGGAIECEIRLKGVSRTQSHRHLFPEQFAELMLVCVRAQETVEKVEQSGVAYGDR